MSLDTEQIWCRHPLAYAACFISNRTPDRLGPARTPHKHTMKISRTLETIAAIPWFQDHDLEATPAERARRALQVRLLQAGHRSADEPVEAAPLRGSPEEFITSGGGRGRKG